MGPTGATVLSAGTEVQGDLRAGEDLRIEGVVRGDVVSDHEVLVAPGALVEGTLRARRARVEGYVGANVQAHERLTITATGQVLGDIRARELSLAPGGRVRGRVESGAEVPLARWAGLDRPARRARDRHPTAGWTVPPSPVKAAQARAAAPPSPAEVAPAPAAAAGAAPQGGPKPGASPREEVVEPSGPTHARGEVVEVEPVPALEPHR